MAVRRTRKQTGRSPVNKSDFVRSFPVDVPAKEVVEAGRRKGIKLSAAYVYNVRSTDALTGRRARESSVGQGGESTRDQRALETQLRQLIVQVGLARAREIFHEVEQTFGLGAD